MRQETAHPALLLDQFCVIMVIGWPGEGFHPGHRVGNALPRDLGKHGLSPSGIRTTLIHPHGTGRFEAPGRFIKVPGGAPPFVLPQLFRLPQEARD
jgi:hypothetical protein